LTRSPIDAGPPAASQSQQGVKLSSEQIQARVAAAASVCLEQLAQHTRRGKCGELWELLLLEVEGRLGRLQEAQQDAQQAQQEQQTQQEQPAKGSGSSSGSKGRKRSAAGQQAAPAAGAGTNLANAAEAATSSAARGVALLSQLVEHGRGCRVDKYDPLFKLASRLVKPEFVGSSSSSGSSDGGSEGQAEVQPLPRGASAVHTDFLCPSLSAQVLRLLLALALSHAKVAGASEGPAAIGKAAPHWVLVFVRAPEEQLLAFTRALITPPGGYDVARFFGQQMLGTIGRCLLAGTAAVLGQ
jgi:U3 small nucleolar RNA-associated protein 20